MAATKKTVTETAGTAQNEPETAAGYKLLHGEFKSRNEAIKEAVKCAKGGIKGYLVLENGTYKISLGEYKSKEAAEAAKQNAKTAGIDAEVSEV